MFGHSGLQLRKKQEKNDTEEKCYRGNMYF